MLIADDKSSIKCNFKNKMPARKGKITGNYLFSTITCHYSIEVHLTYARTRAPSNSDVDFLLSQVSHKEKNSERKQFEIE